MRGQKYEAMRIEAHGAIKYILVYYNCFLTITAQDKNSSSKTMR